MVYGPDRSPAAAGCNETEPHGTIAGAVVDVETDVVRELEASEEIAFSDTIEAAETTFLSFATGRRDNQFISGGENIQPEEIEVALLSLAGVEQAVVVGVPDNEFGMRPVAFVDPPGGNFAEVLALLLPKFKIPIRFHALPADQVRGMKPNRGDLAGLARELS